MKNKSFVAVWEGSWKGVVARREFHNMALPWTLCSVPGHYEPGVLLGQHMQEDPSSLSKYPDCKGFKYKNQHI